MISEIDPAGVGFESVKERLVGAASKADSGQVVANLAVHELARLALDADFSFDETDATRWTIEVDGAVAGLIEFHEDTEPRYRHASIPNGPR